MSFTIRPRRSASGGPIDWKAERGRIDLVAVVTARLGPAPGRSGERGRRLWWRCPFHEDRNPSLGVEPGQPFWRCYGCGAHGDAANLIMRLDGKTFAELAGGPRSNAPTRTRAGLEPRSPRMAEPRPAPAPPPGPEGMTAEAA